MRNKLKKILAILLITITLSACELIVIGTKPKTEIPKNQKSAHGVVYLFKNELDSANVVGASQILADTSGRIYIAIERYDQYAEMERMSRVIGKKPITELKSDTLSSDKLRVKAYFDYITEVSFETLKIQNNWYITGYEAKIVYY